MGWEKDLNKIDKGAWASMSVVTKWVVIFLPTLALLVAIGFALNSLGLIGQTVVERKVFEESFQYSEARKTAIATYEAQLAEINRKLASDVDSQTRTNLESQAAGIRIQLSMERSKQ